MSKVRKCDWCGGPCKETIGARRTQKLSYFNDEAESIEFTQMDQVLYFCKHEHRHEYLFGL